MAGIAPWSSSSARSAILLWLRRTWTDWPDRRVPLPKLPPHCRCGGMARPGVVWFGESLPDGMWLEAEHAAREAEVLLVIGTSALVHPAASLVTVARHSKAKVI